MTTEIFITTNKKISENLRHFLLEDIQVIKVINTANFTAYLEMKIGFEDPNHHIHLYLFKSEPAKPPYGLYLPPDYKIVVKSWRSDLEIQIVFLKLLHFKFWKICN